MTIILQIYDINIILCLKVSPVSCRHYFMQIIYQNPLSFSASSFKTHTFQVLFKFSHRTIGNQSVITEISQNSSEKIPF